MIDEQYRIFNERIGIKDDKHIMKLRSIHSIVAEKTTRA
jgi:hypothetical protein